MKYHKKLELYCSSQDTLLDQLVDMNQITRFCIEFTQKRIHVLFSQK